ncbi:hypothetical protein PIB30_056351 [Stylosanthes scabra]|uniref:Uncharacterized protein n=1 Tax=Stylosanthes scabra TaxID=79078 RepID=A0ABU6YLS2_9FABA|nr:hypothetical protein [Stylosanthes scabra]
MATQMEAPGVEGCDGISWYTIKNMYRDLKKSITDEHNRTRLQIAVQGCQIGLILEKCECRQNDVEIEMNYHPKESATRQRRRPTTRSGRTVSTLGKQGRILEGNNSTSKTERCQRKLDFDIESVDPELCGEVSQDGFGSPFTYGKGNAAHAGVEMPWCFSLVWRPPKEMVFCGAELAVAAYIFNVELPNLEILVDSEHGSPTREMIFSLVPGEILKDYVIDQVGETYRSKRMNCDGSCLRSFL